MSLGNRGAATDTGTWEDCLCVSMSSWPTGIYVAGISPARRFSTNTPSLASFSPAALTAFGERLDNEDDSSSAIRSLGEGWFTGKPHVAGLGHAFLFRNYRASLAKWQTSDPLGYPDGWKQLSYCGNIVSSFVDFLGCRREKVVHFVTEQPFCPEFVVIPWYNSEWDAFGLAKQEAEKAGKSLKDYVNDKLKEYKENQSNQTTTDALLREFLKYFSHLNSGPYNEDPPTNSEDPWKSILEKYEAEGWYLEYGPRHTGITIDYNSDVTNAGLGALIIDGCTHHWEAKFVKE